MSKRFDFRLASKLCAVYLLLLFVAGLPTQADAQRTVSISVPATVTEPANPNEKVLVQCTARLSSGTGPAEVIVKVTGGTATKDQDWSNHIGHNGTFVLPIPANSQSASWDAFYVLGDLKRESDETVQLIIWAVLKFCLGVGQYR